MSDERLMILKMVSDGKISPEEGDRLLSALDGTRTNRNGHRPPESAADFLQRTAQEVQKGLQDFGTRAESGLRKAQSRFKEQSETLRSQLEEMLRATPQPTAKEKNAGAKKRNHTIVIEVEEDDETPPKSSDKMGKKSAGTEGTAHDG